VCTHGSNRALLTGPSTSPLDGTPAVPLVAKSAIASAVASLLAALTLSIAFGRSARFEPPLNADQLAAMRYGDAVAYMAAHTRHLSLWETLMSLVTVPVFWLRIAETAACIFVFAFASTLIAIRWAQRGRSV
jgi:hypothetical protein